MSEDNQDASEAPTARAAEPIPGEEYVRWAYRLLHGREPESAAVVKNHPYKNDRVMLIKEVLGSQEFNTQHSKLLEEVITRRQGDSIHPYRWFDHDALAFIHVPKTGGSTLYSLLATCFSESRICPERFDRLHLYSPLELANFDFFSGHFDCFSVRFIPRRRVRCVSIFRDPCQRLISWYRFCRSLSTAGEFEHYVPVKLAHELDASEFFEHHAIKSRTDANNAYVFYLSSLAADPLRLDGVSCPLDATERPAFHASSPAAGMPDRDYIDRDHIDKDVLAQALLQVMDLDGIGLTERFSESVELIFSTLGLAIPESITPRMVTDELPNSDFRYSPVPPIEMTSRLSQAVERLTRYDRIIYNAAKREFERRIKKATSNSPSRNEQRSASGQ